MNPPLVKARWLADEGNAEIVLMDDGELRCRADGIDMLIASPWDEDEEPSAPNPVSDPGAAP